MDRARGSLRLLAAGVGVGVVIGTALPAAADDHGTDRLSPRLARAALAKATNPSTSYEMPFPCGQAWTGTTRSSHSPSPLSVDWNRIDDLGDPIVAAAPGVVTVADTVVDSGYGRWVVVDHGKNESTIYAHMSAVAVKVGQQVDQGTLLGYVGDSGNTTGPHLHFEERVGSVDATPYFHGKKFVFGTTPASQNCVDVPLAGNMNGGAEAEPVYFTRADPATFTVVRLVRSPRTFTYGVGTDEPVLGDWDGDGHANLGVRTPGSSTFSLQNAAGGTATIVFGRTSDKPIAGDWDGNGTWEVGVRRSATSAFLLRSSSGSVQRVVLGDANDLAVTGDWNGDGASDLGVFDQATATFTLRLVDGDGLQWLATVPFGKAGDLPVVGDWDGNGKTDLGAWDPATAVLTQRLATAPTAARWRSATRVIGHPR